MLHPARRHCILHAYVCLQACKKHKVAAGVFCLGQERASQLAAKGFVNIAYGTDTGSLMDFVSNMQKQLQGPAAQ